MSTKPTVSVLASFDVNHFGKLQNVWPIDSFPNVEVYAFMHNCLPELFGASATNIDHSALRVLSQARQDPEAPGRIAAKINAHFPSSEKVKSKIPAISTFLPEISAPENFEVWKDAQHALEFLVLTIAELREKHGHPCNVLELVGGSRVDGIWRGERLTSQKIYVVNRVNEAEGIARLLRRLKPVAELASKNNVRLALEMEPGPLFTIGDWKSIRSFCEALESEEGPLHSCVGLNLDIAHWDFLGGISPQMVRNHPCIYNRICHAHISDHNRGHCSDAIPSFFHSAEEFLPWCDLLVDRMNSKSQPEKGVLPYSGFVSCELESAYDLETVRMATQIVQFWFDYCC